jgi:hemolysin activation/secretion protein
MNARRYVLLARWACVLALFHAGLASAQRLPPTGGQILRELEPLRTPENVPTPGIEVGPPPATPAGGEAKIWVRRLAIEGNTAAETAELHSLVAYLEGREVTLTELQAAAHRITLLYRARGYPLARALVPAQTPVDGVVRIVVMEARYDQVALDNRSRIEDALLWRTLSEVQQGQPVEQPPLDAALLRIGDLPGARASATLSPGGKTGTTDVTVHVDPAARFAGNVGADNLGSRYTGRGRASASLGVNNLSGWGDLLGADVLTSGSGLHYGRLGYSTALNGYGTRLGLSYSALDYRIGKELHALDARGRAYQGSLWLMHPFVRGPQLNISGLMQLDHKRLEDDINSIDFYNRRRTLDWTTALMVNRRDEQGGGVTSGSLSFTLGRLRFDDDEARRVDEEFAGTQGHFTRWNLSVSRLQPLTARTRLYVSLTGQYSGRNLDSGEQFLLGGPGSIRGYDVTTLAGASGYQATIELQHTLAVPLPGQWDASVFADTGKIWVDPEGRAAGANHAGLSSVGLGLLWSGPAQWTANVQVATPVGPTPSMAGLRPSTRVWLQVSKGF